MRPTKAKILLIEGKRADHVSFTPGLVQKGYQVESVPSGSAALARLEELHPDLVVVDASSMRTSGTRICHMLRQEMPALPLLLVVEPDSVLPDHLEANVVLALPFTLQKLVNRIRPLLPVEQKKDTLQVGLVRLDVEQRWASCDTRQVRLTPRLVILLRILMEHAGEVIERKDLFRLVWETEYTGDTRTLDVHISWLRQALEADPRHPRYIKTVRGMGYRLDAGEDPRRSANPSA